MVPPSRTGFQDVAAPIASQEVVRESLGAHLMASPFGTIHAATFSFRQPVGTGIPAGPGLHIAAYTPSSGAADTPARAPPAAANVDLQSQRREFPEINRGLKGPRLVPRVRPDFDSPQPSTIDGASLSAGLQADGPTAPTASATDKAASDRTEAADAKPTPEPDDADFAYLDPSFAETAESWLVDGGGTPVRTARIYFATAWLGGTPATLEPWGPGQAPMFEPQEPDSATAAPNVMAPFQPPPNETIAPKGEVTGKEHRPKSPAERLGLIGAVRAKHEKCLADAVYFEARGESVRGQMAVAQVVINRVFSGHYPNNICGVVYQNAHRRLRCQFTFACDGRPERVDEPAAWERAKHIARDALDGKFWLNDVGKATHYHARWVHPWWVREMRKLDRIGVHTFYRPRNWGDGSNSPTWGDAEATTTVAKAL